MIRFPFLVAAAAAVMGLFNHKNASAVAAKEAPKMGSHFSSLVDSGSVWGHSGFCYEEIRRARRKIHRGKTFRRFGSSLAFHRAHAK